METLKELLGEGRARNRINSKNDLICNIKQINDYSIFYRNDILNHKSRVKGEDDLLCVEFISKYIIKNELFKYDVVKESDYSIGDRKNITDKLIGRNFFEYINELSVGKKGTKKMMEDRICHCMFFQGKVSNCKIIDYQIPLVNGGANNIDIMFEDAGKCHIAEVKKFESDETLLRCILEIETYYQQISDSNFKKVYNYAKKDLIKTVLVPRDSEAYKEFDVMQKGALPYMKELFNYFGIELYAFSLNDKDNKFIIEKVN